MGIEYKLIAGGILALILGCAAYFGLHQVYAAGEAHTQLAWDKDRIAIQAAADKQIAQLAAERDMAVRANEGITNDLQAQIIAARASADAYATSLRDTRTRLAALSSQMPKAANNASPLQEPPHQAWDNLMQLLVQPLPNAPKSAPTTKD